ncbi:hypothetical protein ACWEKT_27255 [Nocardia takedensis]
MEIDYAELGRRLFVPRRADPSVAEAAMTRTRSARAAWLDLFGDDGSRRTFLHYRPCRSCDGSPFSSHVDYDWDDVPEVNDYVCGRCAGTGADPWSEESPYPQTSHVLALGDSVEAVRFAERRALEAAALLADWGLPPVERVIWRIGDLEEIRNRFSHRVLPYEVNSAVGEVLRGGRGSGATDVAESIRSEPVPRALFDPHDDVHELARTHAAWEQAACDGSLVTEWDTSRCLWERSAPTPGTPFADMPNPYTPLLEVWAAGFGVERIEEGALVLYALAAPSDPYSGPRGVIARKQAADTPTPDEYDGPARGRGLLRSIAARWFRMWTW